MPNKWRIKSANKSEDLHCQKRRIYVYCSGLSGFLVSAAAHADFRSSEPDGCIAKSDGYMYTVVACQAFWLVLLLAHVDFRSPKPDGIGYQPAASARFENCTRSMISARVGSSGIVGSARLIDYLEAALQTTIIPSSITSTWAATPI
ncbi:hypothetical protein ACFX1Q_031735 [Malus domestica]